MKIPICLIRCKWPVDTDELRPGSKRFDAVYKSARIKGIQKPITIDLDWWNISGIPLDSIIVKFTFKSDSVNNFKDGWQIDNLCIKYLIPLGIEEIESKNNLNVYPNPTQDYFIVNYNLQDNSKAVFRLYDVMGKEVIIQPITDMVGELKISSSTLKQGIYFYQVIGEKENFFGKLIIQ